MIAPLALVVLSVFASASASAPRFTLHPDSQLKGSPSVEVLPLRVASIRGKTPRNVFTFGAETHVKLGVTLSVPVVAGATAEAWLSSLSLGSAARLAANNFIPYTDLCSELRKLPASVRRELALPASFNCPIKKLKRFAFDRVLKAGFWEAIETYVWKERVIGATGTLEVRLWSKRPCTACVMGPTLLAGFSLPFEIADDDGTGTTKTTTTEKGGKTEKGKKRNTEL